MPMFLEEIQIALKESDKFCKHGSVNYPSLQMARTKFHWLLTKLQKPDDDFLNIQIQSAMLVSRLNNNQYPYDLHTLPQIDSEKNLQFFKDQRFSVDEIKLFKAFIAEVLMCSPSQDRQFRLDYIQNTGMLIPPQGEPACTFYNDTYYNGVKAMIFGLGACELRADALFNELLRTGTMEELSLIEFKPSSHQGPLEQLFCVVVGTWPQPGCSIIAPWLPSKERIFSWQGNLSQTPSFAHALGDSTKLEWENHCSLTGANIDSFRSFSQKHISFIESAHRKKQAEIDSIYERLNRAFQMDTYQAQASQKTASVAAITPATTSTATSATGQPFAGLLRPGFLTSTQKNAPKGANTTTSAASINTTKPAAMNSSSTSVAHSSTQSFLGFRPGFLMVRNPQKKNSDDATQSPSPS